MEDTSEDGNPKMSSEMYTKYSRYIDEAAHLTPPRAVEMRVSGLLLQLSQFEGCDGLKKRCADILCGLRGAGTAIELDAAQ